MTSPEPTGRADLPSGVSLASDRCVREQAVGCAEGGSGRFPVHDSQLLAQSKVLQMQRRAAEESLTDHGKDDLNGRSHVGDAIRHEPEMLEFPQRIGFIGATGRRFL